MKYRKKPISKDVSEFVPKVKEKNVLLPAKIIRLGVPYALTIHIDDQPSLYLAYDKYKAIFDQLQKIGVKYVFYPELTTLNRRLHYHGWVWFDRFETVMTYYNLMGKKIQDVSAFRMDEIIDYEWRSYCIKERHLMKPYMHKMKLSYKITTKQDLKSSGFVTAKEEFANALDDGI